MNAQAPDPAIKRTLGTVFSPIGTLAIPSGVDDSRVGPVDLDETVDARTIGFVQGADDSKSSSHSPRTTVLPRRSKVSGAKLLSEEQPRFHRLRILGEGGMGQV